MAPSSRSSPTCVSVCASVARRRASRSGGARSTPRSGGWSRRGASSLRGNGCASACGSGSVPDGRVVLVGAGPGNPELITLLGLRWLRRADVVIHDRLVSEKLLDEAPADALRIFAGKARGRHCLEQSAINTLLVHHAAAGRLVVRLKGGDPFVFG